MSSIREPSFEAKMLREAIDDEVEWLRFEATPEEAKLAEVLERLGNGFMSKVYVRSEG